LPFARRSAWRPESFSIQVSKGCLIRTIPRRTVDVLSRFGYIHGTLTPTVASTRTNPVSMRVASAPAQTITPERAAGFVTSGMWLDYGAALCQPDTFDRALGAGFTSSRMSSCVTV